MCALPVSAVLPLRHASRPAKSAGREKLTFGPCLALRIHGHCHETGSTRQGWLPCDDSLGRYPRGEEASHERRSVAVSLTREQFLDNLKAPLELGWYFSCATASPPISSHSIQLETLDHIEHSLEDG